MKTIRGEYLILIGFVMVLLGAILPFLMVMRIITSTFFLNFFSYGMSVLGLFLGLIGSAYFVRYHRRKNRGTLEPPEMPPDKHQDW
jgi:hypothetical protein